MDGISSMAYGKLQTNFGYQGKEMQSGEFYDGSGLEEYDFEARYYDPQLMRWHNQLLHNGESIAISRRKKTLVI